MSENWQVHISVNDALQRNAKIAIIRPVDEDRADRTETYQWTYQYVATDGTTKRTLVSEGVDGDPEDFWHLVPREVLPAMYTAFSRYMGGPEPQTPLRQDYEAERARVDKLIDAVIAG